MECGAEQQGHMTQILVKMFPGRGLREKGFEGWIGVGKVFERCRGCSIGASCQALALYPPPRNSLFYPPMDLASWVPSASSLKSRKPKHFVGP